MLSELDIAVYVMILDGYFVLKDLSLKPQVI